MEQVKEMWNLIFNWIGNGKKMIMGGAFLLVGIIAQAISNSVAAHIPFVFMAIGLMCFVNALISKVSKYNINLLLFLLLNLLAAEILFGITALGIADGMTLLGIWIAGGILVWILQIFLIKTDGIPKRVVLAFLETILSSLAIGIAFALPIFIKVWGDNHG